MYQIPEALQPGRHRVHSSYIWIDGLRVVFTVFFATAVSVSGSIVPAFMEGSGMPMSAVPWIIGLSALFVVVATALIFFIQWLSWKNLSYELTEGEFNLYSGILNKKRTHVPYQRVQAVNQNAGVLQRLLGLCSVKIDTAGGAENEAVSLRCVRISDAEALRSELFRRKKVLLAGGSIDKHGNVFVEGTVIPSVWTIACFGGDAYAALVSLGVLPDQAAAAVAASYDPSNLAVTVQSAEGNILDKADEVLQDVRGVFGGQEVATGTVSYETGLSNKELALAGVSGAADYLGILAAGAIGVAALVMPAIEGMIGSWVESALNDMVSVEVDGVAQAVTATAWGMVLWMVGALVFLWVLSALGTVVKYGGFKARRRENRIEVEHGLLKRTFHGVDVDRVQSVIIDQGLITRQLGYCELRVGKIDSVESSESGSAGLTSGVVLHPFVKLDRVPEILAGLLPEFSDIPQEVVKPAPVALRRAVIRKALVRSSLFYLFLIALVAQAVLKIGLSDVLGAEVSSIVQVVLYVAYALFAVALFVHIADAVLWHKRSGLGYNRMFVSMTDGGLTVKTLVFPRKKIQFAHTQANPFQRLAHVKTVAITTAAGVSGTTESLWDIGEEDADAFLDWVQPGGADRIPRGSGPYADERMTI